MRYSEYSLQQFAAPLSETEEAQCKHAVEMIRDALKKMGFSDDGKGVTKYVEGTNSYRATVSSSTFGNVDIFVQGSYANNTNVRRCSDVDVAVVWKDSFMPKYRQGVAGSQYGHTDSSHAPLEFKDEVQRALTNEFGSDVTRGNKSIKVAGNSYRKDADAVPAVGYRDYSKDFSFDSANCTEGITIYPDKGSPIINYPKQHIENGRKKNSDTNHYYKKAVRIVKKIALDMKSEGIDSAHAVSSFKIESLLWNVPDWVFLGAPSLTSLLEETVVYLCTHASSFAAYKEANGIKELCATQAKIKSLQQFVEDLKRFIQ